MQGSWTASAALPGGEQMGSVAELSERLCQQFGWLPLSLAKRHMAKALHGIDVRVTK